MIKKKTNQQQNESHFQPGPREYVDDGQEELPPLTKKEAQSVLDTIEAEGFDYAFRYYSDFKKIKNPGFHNLRLAYVDAASKLEDYIDNVIKKK